MHFRKRIVVNETTVDEMPDRSMRTDFHTKIAIHEALKQMPKGYRNVLMLHAVAGFDCNETGKILGVTSGTVKSQFSKAKAKMRRCLGRRANPMNYRMA